jgi:hypothetical protein
MLSGCAGPAAIDPADLHTGIYDLKVSTNIDTCDPPRSTGDVGRYGIFVDSDGFSVVDVAPPPLGSIQRYALRADQGYELSIGPILSCGGAALQATWQLASATTDDVVINIASDWTVSMPCTDGSVYSPAPPSASCHVDQDQTYHRVTVCDAPCTVRQEPPEQPVCVCP